MTAPFRPLTKPDVAEILGVSVRTIENWIDEGILDEPGSVGARVFWHPDDFYGWLERQLRAPRPVRAPRENSPTAKQSRVERTPLPVKSEKERLRARDEDKLSALLT